LAIEWLTGRLRAEETRQRREELAAAQAVASGPRQILQLTGPAGATATAVLTPQTWGTAIELTAAAPGPSPPYTGRLEGPGGTRTSAATFQPGSAGTAGMSLTTSTSLTISHAFGVSLLPRPGEVAGADVFVSRLASGQPVA